MGRHHAAITSSNSLNSRYACWLSQGGARTLFGRNIVVKNSVMAVAWFLVQRQCLPNLDDMLAEWTTMAAAAGPGRTSFCRSNPEPTAAVACGGLAPGFLVLAGYHALTPHTAAESPSCSSYVDGRGRASALCRQPAPAIATGRALEATAVPKQRTTLPTLRWAPLSASALHPDAAHT